MQPNKETEAQKDETTCPEIQFKSVAKRVCKARHSSFSQKDGYFTLVLLIKHFKPFIHTHTNTTVHLEILGKYTTNNGMKEINQLLESKNHFYHSESLSSIKNDAVHKKANPEDNKDPLHAQEIQWLIAEQVHTLPSLGGLLKSINKNANTYRCVYKFLVLNPTFLSDLEF